MFRIHRILSAAIAAGGLHGQITQVDLHYQGKNIDFSSTTATKPFKSGTTMPSVCAVGEMFFKSDGPPGANVYGCTSLNSWTLEQSPIPGVAGNNGKVMTTDGTSLMFGSLGGDISGPVSGATVTQLQGRPVSSSPPGSGQALAWNATTNRWEPQSIAGGAGASLLSQLGDFLVTRSSPTVLTAGTSCSAATPCAVRFGNTVYSFASSATITITAGTGTIYEYISSAGILTVGHNVTLVCSGCTAQSGITAFPSDSIPLWTWTATTGTWDTTGGTDRRAFLSNQPIGSGPNFVVTCASGICSGNALLDTITGNGLWIQKSPSVAQTIQPGASGAITMFAPTSTDPAIVIGAGALPSTPVAGELCMTNGGVHCYFDGTNINYFPYLAGSVNTPPAIPAAGFATFGGVNYSLIRRLLALTDMPTFPRPQYAPAAVCVNSVASTGWSTGATPAALCRAGTNNKAGLLSPWGASDTANIQFRLPKDWNSGASTDLSLDLTSTDATNGHTIIMQAATSCAKGDGSTTDDVAFNTAQSFSTITLNGNANRTWTATITGLTTTGCAAQSTLFVKISRTTDTATNVGVYGALLDVPVTPVVQAQ